jgi:hypothetical protein
MRDIWQIREQEAPRRKPRFSIGLLVAMGSITAIEGCGTETSQYAYGQLPQYCTYTVAGGAAIGTLVGDNIGADTGDNTATGAIIGALLGAGLGGAIGGGRGAAVGAASGLALGGVTGAQADAQCRQLADQRAIEMAEAASAQAMQAMAANRTPPVRLDYQSVGYRTPSTMVRHKIVPLYRYIDPATGMTCWTMGDVSFRENGSPNSSAERRVCKSADGKLHEP